MTGLEARKCATANTEGKMKLMLCPPQSPGSQPLRVLLPTHLSSLFLLSLHSAGSGGIARCWGYRGKSSMAPALLRQKDNYPGVTPRKLWEWGEDVVMGG